MYMIGQQKPDNNMSELYKNKLISEFPKSEYALALSDPDYVNNYLKKRREVEDLYQLTYLAYLKNDTSSVRQAYQKALKDFPMSKLNAKFAFLNALVYINQKNNKGFKKALQELLEKYPNTDVTELAGSMMTGLALGKEISGEKVNTDIWSKRVIAAEVKEQTIVTEAEFTIDPISPHFVLFAYPTDSTYNNRLMYDVAAFNFSNFAIRDFDFDMFPLQGIGLLRVKGFATFSEVLIYKERLFGPKGIGHKLPTQLKTVLISEKNFNSLMKGRTFAEYFEFYNKNLDKKQDK
jgi:tetratricopeptide (TPR) repeat protein